MGICDELDIMRITGGSLKGRRPAIVKGFAGRPTTEFGRESLFNLLRTRVDIDGLDVLDLFAGTGMVSMEFASRGAASVLSIDGDARAMRHLKQTFDVLGLENCQAVRADVGAYLTRVPQAFDLVFADPPYDWPDLLKLPQMIVDASMLQPGDWFIVEHGERTDLSMNPGFQESRKYGQVHFSLFRQPDVKPQPSAS